MKNIREKKDHRLTKLLNSKYFYFVLLILLVIYLRNHERILNEPTHFFPIRTLFALFLIGMFSYSRFRKFKNYYKRKLRDRITVIFYVVLHLFFIFLLQGLLDIPIGLAIKSYAKNSKPKIFKCDIKNVNTTGFDKITFVFLGKRYSRYFVIHNHTRKEIISDFYLEVAAKKSLWGSYYLESMELKEKY